jgi:hypothetical protein
MSRSDFDEFVRRQQSGSNQDAAPEAAFDAAVQLEEWRSYLDTLYKQITEFVAPYIENGSAHVEYRPIELIEDFSGPYHVREMLLKIGRSVIVFTPIGTMLIGMKGRVDVKGPAGTARLALINKKITSGSQLIQVRVTFAGEAPSPPPPSREAIRNIEWSWKIISRPPEMKFTELTQEAFFDMVLSVANA